MTLIDIFRAARMVFPVYIDISIERRDSHDHRRSCSER